MIRYIYLMNKATDIIPLNKSHIKRVSKVCAMAFFNDPHSIHIIPDEKKRKRALRHLFDFAISYGIRYGKGYALSSDIRGVAIWLPSETATINLYRLVRAGFLSAYMRVGPAVTSRLMSFIRHSISVQENNYADYNWHLFLLAVNPAHQGNGYASALLNSMFSRIDGERLTCYLETHNEKNVNIYKRHGFEVIHTGPVPNTSVNAWAMARRCN